MTLQHHLHIFVAYLKNKFSGGKVVVDLYNRKYDGEKGQRKGDKSSWKKRWVSDREDIRTSTEN